MTKAHLKTLCFLFLELDPEVWTDTSDLSQVPEHLRSYQCTGLAWLIRLYSLGIGGLLADDMGLGKTHQGLALLQAIARDHNKLLTLVVCPASVVLNWADKIEQYFQDLDYSVYYGTRRGFEKEPKQGLILTTYGILRQDFKKLRKYTFDVILLDEIQHLKNRTTLTHKAAAGMKSRVKIGLTGTPVENSLQDIRSLFDICLPGFLGTERQFENQYVRPITKESNLTCRRYRYRSNLRQCCHPFR